MSVQTIILRADQPLHLGVGRGSGFSVTTYPYVPASTLRGAFAAAWWRDHAPADQSAFDSLIAGVTFSDAVPIGQVDGYELRGLAMDRRVCRQGHHPCDGFDPTTDRCPTCGGWTEHSKGERPLPEGASVMTSARVALDPSEQAIEDRLFERQALRVTGARLAALAAGDLTGLVRVGAVVRVGAAKSVAGRLEVVGIRPLPVPDIRLPAGAHRLRIQMLTPGVFVDEFGCPSNHPSECDLRLALQMDDSARIAVDATYARWTTVSGWHSRANRPKPEDPGVLAHSCCHISVHLAAACAVPSLVHDLGLRTTEGCGWAAVSSLARHGEAPDAQ